jgi:drug/metabolite transporter (DMT)-like permease
MILLTGQATRATVQGMLAILFWSTSVAFSRRLSEALGTLTSAGLIYSMAGMVALVSVGWIGKKNKIMLSLPLHYLLGCGSLFVVYIAFFYLSIGMSSSREQVLLVGLINYLWLGLSLLFSIPILGKHGKAFLVPGMIVALAGVCLATVGSTGFTRQFLESMQQNILPYGLILAAAIIWGLYSNLSRRWAGNSQTGAVPLFLMASGLLLLTCSRFYPENGNWSLEIAIELVFMACFPAFLAYYFWDTAVRKGDMLLVASLSYLTPIISSLISTMILNISVDGSFWLGTLLVAVGGMICKSSIE